MVKNAKIILKMLCLAVIFCVPINQGKKIVLLPNGGHKTYLDSVTCFGIIDSANSYIVIRNGEFYGQYSRDKWFLKEIK